MFIKALHKLELFFSPGAALLDPLELEVSNSSFKISYRELSGFSLTAVHRAVSLDHGGGDLQREFRIIKELWRTLDQTLVAPHLVKPSLVPTNNSSPRTRTVNLRKWDCVTIEGKSLDKELRTSFFDSLHLSLQVR